MMSLEENKALVRQMYELMNRKELDAAHEFLSPGFQMETLTREQLIQLDIMYFNAFPDAKAVMLDMVAEGDKVVFIVNGTGTHTGGPYMGIQPTGKKIDITNTWLVRIVDKKIVEWKGTGSFVILLQQLGVMPAIEEAIQAYNDSLK
ncbi:MAG TPA: ester cyclase [Dehalococcoidia bacterium]|nr:ester cyclase [Dehalococcoidia bacterium]